MTVCVYYKETLAGDGRTTYGSGDIRSDNRIKIGMIYQCKATRRKIST